MRLGELMFESLPQYKTYILRIWEERDPKTESSARWRYTLTDPRSNQRHGFNNLRDLCQFLELNLSQPTNDL